MQQFRVSPFIQKGEVATMAPEHNVVATANEQLLDDLLMSPVIREPVTGSHSGRPFFSLVEDFPLVNTDPLTESPMRETAKPPAVSVLLPLASSPRSTAPTTLSLIDVLQSSIATPYVTGRLVVIPGSPSRKHTTKKLETYSQQMSARLRYGIILAAILFIGFTTLISLAPLDNGQSTYHIFDSIGGWVHSSQLSRLFPAQLQPGQAPQNKPHIPLPPVDLPKSQYVAIAQQDAINAGISPDYFVRQINQESGFNPNAGSPAGAVGIAQFIPSTAATIGVNPYNPVDALRAAANLMASYDKQYGGDHAKALAAYNGGGGTVQSAVNAGGTNWMNFLPFETRNYIHTIMGI